MEKPGVCQICRKELASFTCKLCGASVGISCYDPIAGICIKCKLGRSAP